GPDVAQGGVTVADLEVLQGELDDQVQGTGVPGDDAGRAYRANGHPRTITRHPPQRQPKSGRPCGHRRQRWAKISDPMPSIGTPAATDAVGVEAPTANPLSPADVVIVVLSWNRREQTLECL